MKKFAALMLTTLSACALFAQNAPKPAQNEAQVNAALSALGNMDVSTRVQLLKRFDKDGDGHLSKEERAEADKAIRENSEKIQDLRKEHAERILKKFDKDNDGKLAIDELMTFLEEQRKMFEKFRERRAPRNMDRRLSKEVIAKFDKDGDGKLSREERRNMFMETRRKHNEIMKKYDGDNDGKLSDTEKEALVNSPEFKTMMKQMMGDRIPTPPPQR